MPNTAIYTREAAFAKANVIKASLETSKLRMFKQGLTINVSTTRALLLDNECDFSGYTPGGYDIAAFTGPVNGDTGGAAISTPLVTSVFDATIDPSVGNDVGGYWIEDANEDGPFVREVIKFTPAKPMAADGDAIQILNTITEGLNTITPSE